MEYNRENLLDVLRAIFKWKRPIFFTCLAVGILSVIVTLLLPVYYKASTTFYAASPTLQSPAVIFGDGNQKLEFYGESEDMDRVIQCANSNELLDYMVNEFNLYEHYDIDTSNIKASYKIASKFFGLFTIEKNERNAIELSIEDKDRLKVAKMANAARVKINDIANGLIRQSQEEIIHSYENGISEKQKTLAVLSDSISSIRRRYQIFDPETQRKVLGLQIPSLKSQLAGDKAMLEVYKKQNRRDSINVITARIIGNTEKLKGLTQYENGLDLSKGMSMLDQLSQTEQTIMEELGEDQSNYEKYKAAFNTPKPALFVQDKAETPVVKSWPKRSYMVLGATFLAFFFCILGVLILEYNRDVDWKEIVNSK